MSDAKIKQRFYPLKPKTEEGFKKAVAWLGGREFIASLKGVIIYAIYGENMDPRSWMKPNIYPNVEEKVKFQEEAKIKDTIKVDNRDYKNINAVIENQCIKQFKESPQIQKQIEGRVNLEWAKKIFDHWEWKRKHFRFWEAYLKNQPFWTKLQENLNAVKSKQEGETEFTEKLAEELADAPPVEEFWFDYIADTGDGQMGVYGVGCMCFSDFWLTSETVGAKVAILPPAVKDAENYKLLPRGTFLFVGGDTAYHSANYATLFERFQSPFRWAFMSVRKLASARYILKRTANEKFFVLDGKPKNVFKADTIEPVDDWDGTIGDTIEGKLYWDTEPLRPIFGVPANHDYYDSIDGFNKQFRRAPFDEIEENMVYDDDKSRMVLQIPTFSREQEASYVAIRLPFGWWMFGIDSENAKLDYRQEVFFKQIMKHQPKKLILTTPEPTTVFGKLSSEKDKTATYLKTITQSLGLKQPFLNRGKFARLEGKELKKLEKREESESQYGLETEPHSNITQSEEKYCRLDLSGDIHHYARYWGENTREFNDGDFASGNYASLVAGGGGAFFDATETLIGRAYDSHGNRISEHRGEKVRGEIPPQKVYPGENESRKRTADRLFDLWNIKKGGYVQTAGAVFAVIIYSFLLHFSNASLVYSNIRENGIVVYFTLPENLTDFFLYSDFKVFTPFIAGFILTATAVLLGISGYKLNILIESLMEKFFEEEIDENEDGRIKQVLRTFYPFLMAVAFYIAFLIFLPANLHPFTKSYFLFVHVIICGLLVWLSMDYANWLPVRFQIIRTFNEKTITQMVEDPNEATDKWYLKLLGQLSREYSYKYFPAHLLVIFAIFVFITGIRRFGNGILSGTFADLLLLAVVFGNFATISYLLAVKTGAAYYKGDSGYEKKYRFYFLLLGTWHALLQLLTPFIFYFYTNIYIAVLIAVIVVIVNGLPITTGRLKYFIKKKENEPEKAGLLNKIFSYRAATNLMVNGNRSRFTRFWVFYGLIVLVVPIMVFAVLQWLYGAPEPSGLFSHRFTVYQLVEYLTLKILRWVNLLDYSKQVFFLASVLTVGYLGYYLSRVWFCWYLAVSLAFNGHNNEAGGAARIEGFKHILRIKVEKEKLTVYVIGFDDAKPEIEQLSLRLVDKFSLEPKPVQ